MSFDQVHSVAKIVKCENPTILCDQIATHSSAKATSIDFCVQSPQSSHRDCHKPPSSLIFIPNLADHALLLHRIQEVFERLQSRDILFTFRLRGRRATGHELPNHLVLRAHSGFSRTDVDWNRTALLEDSKMCSIFRHLSNL